MTVSIFLQDNIFLRFVHNKKKLPLRKCLFSNFPEKPWSNLIALFQVIEWVWSILMEQTQLHLSLAMAFTLASLVSSCEKKTNRKCFINKKNFKQNKTNTNSWFCEHRDWVKVNKQQKAKCCWFVGHRYGWDENITLGAWTCIHPGSSLVEGGNTKLQFLQFWVKVFMRMGQISLH